jgi:hypothetical protein
MSGNSGGRVPGAALLGAMGPLAVGPLALALPGAAGDAPDAAPALPSSPARTEAPEQPLIKSSSKSTPWLCNEGKNGFKANTEC